MKLLNEVMTFIKFRIAILSTMSAATGFIMAEHGFSLGLAIFVLGLFLLAGGAAALNQFQERTSDGKMLRTQDRPLPSGRLTPAMGMLIVVLCLGAGLAILYLRFGLLPAALGALTVVLYNGMYTYLKRVSAFAAVPGALIGALPPAIGWIAAGGAVDSPMLVGLVIFFFMWQVPHFWLLLGIHASDYTRAGFPCLTDIFTTRQLSRITFTWIAATACAGLLFPLFGIFSHWVSIVFLTGLILWLSIRSVSLVLGETAGAMTFRKVFMNINIFALLLMIMMIIDHGVLV